MSAVRVLAGCVCGWRYGTLYQYQYTYRYPYGNPTAPPRPTKVESAHCNRYGSQRLVLHQTVKRESIGAPDQRPATRRLETRLTNHLDQSDTSSAADTVRGCGELQKYFCVLFDIS